MLDIEQTKSTILEIIKQRGPSLPVHISTRIQLSPTFTSAILSELSQEKRIKLSNLKVGASPLYLIPGQETQLEKFTENLGGFEKSAYLKLKENKILQDNQQEPAIRVAIRSIKDFAFPFKFQDILYWKYFTVSNDEIQNILNKPKKKIPQKLPETIPTKIQPLLQIKPPKPKKQNFFLEEVKSFLLKKDIELLQEIQTDKKQIIAKIRINSDFGKLIFLLIAKDKKRISQADLTLAYQKAIHEKMPCYFLSKGEASKKTQEFLEDYKDLIKIDKIL